MTLIQASGLRKNRSALPQRAFSRPPRHLWLVADATYDEPTAACDLQAEPLPPQIWMSEATRARACAMQDAADLPLTFRLALGSLTRLYGIPEQIGGERG